MNNPAYLYCEGYRAAIEAGNQGAIEIVMLIAIMAAVSIIAANIKTKGMK